MSPNKPAPFRVALCSAPMRDNQIQHQLEVMRVFLQASPPAHLLCFGESFIQGFEGLTWDYGLDCQRALAVDGPRMQAIRALAQEYNCGLSFGFIEHSADGLYSSNIVLDAHGNTVDLFRRVSIGWKEHSITGPQYREGSGFHSFDMQGIQTATAICGDLWYEENIAALRALNPQLLLWPLYVDYSIADWEPQTKAEYVEQAGKLDCPVLMINSLVDDPQRANGGLCVFYRGKLLAELPMGQGGSLSFDLHHLVQDPENCSFQRHLLDFSQLS